MLMLTLDVSSALRLADYRGEQLSLSLSPSVFVFESIKDLYC